MLKVELHTHTSDDPHDYIPHSSTALIDRAAELGYGGLAITLHDRWLDPGDLAPYARARGVVLIPGVERTIDHRHVLLINFGPAAERVESFEALAALRQQTPNGLVIAPHPFYPFPTCLGRLLEPNADVFDAVEFNAFYTSTVNRFNRTALTWAATHRKPVVANSDVHRLWQLGTTYSLVDAEPGADANAICSAIRAGRVEIRTKPLPTVRAALYFADLVSCELRRPDRHRRGRRAAVPTDRGTPFQTPGTGT